MLSQGTFTLRNKVYDLSAFQVRHVVTEDDLLHYYDSFINHAEEIRDYFKDTQAFDTALEKAAGDKQPKLIPRALKYPFMWAVRTSFMPHLLQAPGQRRLNDKYFMGAHCQVAIPMAGQPNQESAECRHLDQMLREDIQQKFTQYPGYEGIIEVPDHKSPAETKCSIFHESLHYLILRYRSEIGRSPFEDFIRKDMSPSQQYEAEYAIHEGATEILTDKLLSYDPDAQLEDRWLRYSVDHPYWCGAHFLSAVATGVLLGFSFQHPYLLPVSLVPGRIRDYAMIRHRHAMRDKLLEPAEYPEFKL